MENKFDQHMDDFLRESVGDFSPEIPEMVWGKLDGRLDGLLVEQQNAELNSMSKKLNFFKILSGISLSCLLFLSAVYFFNLDFNTNNSLINTNTEIAQNFNKNEILENASALEKQEPTANRKAGNYAAENFTKNQSSSIFKGQKESQSEPILDNNASSTELVKTETKNFAGDFKKSNNSNVSNDDIHISMDPTKAVANRNKIKNNKNLNFQPSKESKKIEREIESLIHTPFVKNGNDLSIDSAFEKAEKTKKTAALSGSSYLSFDNKNDDLQNQLENKFGGIERSKMELDKIKSRRSNLAINENNTENWESVQRRQFNNAFEIPNLQSFNKKWNYYAFVSPLIFQQKLSLADPADLQSLASMEFYENTEKPSLSWGAGLNIGYQLFKNIELKTGLEFLRLNQEINYPLMAVYSQGEYSSNLSSSLSNNEISFQSNQYQEAAIEANLYEFNLSLNQQLDYFKIPIYAQYEYGIKGLVFNLEAGFQGNVLLKESIQSKNSVVSNLNHGQSNDLAAMFWSYSVGAGIEYKFWKDLGMFVQFQYLSGFDSQNKNRSVLVKQKAQSLKLGFIYSKTSN